MGTNYLIDKNIIIYHFKDLLHPSFVDKVNRMFSESFNISAITKIEFLGWKGFNDEQYRKSVNFLNNANLISISDQVVDATINLRRKKKIKLPDAVIAATCIIHGMTLVTANDDDFKKIDDLELLPVVPYFENE